MTFAPVFRQTLLDGGHVGGGTSPDGFLSLADEILYGDKGDWLNDDYGPLGSLERRVESNSARLSAVPRRHQAGTDRNGSHTTIGDPFTFGVLVGAVIVLGARVLTWYLPIWEETP